MTPPRSFDRDRPPIRPRGGTPPPPHPDVEMVLNRDASPAAGPDAILTAAAALIAQAIAAVTAEIPAAPAPKGRPMATTRRTR